MIADSATELDPSIKPGSLISPLPDAKKISDWIAEIIPDQAKASWTIFFIRMDHRHRVRKD
ncbi:hypothetical protein OH687_17815 [Burkholderia anthina]|nr:hypothetical protein OH687_17815 [Burkholderia anthina]